MDLLGSLGRKSLTLSVASFLHLALQPAPMLGHGPSKIHDWSSWESWDHYTTGGGVITQTQARASFQEEKEIPAAWLEGQDLGLQRCTEVLMHIHASPVLRLAGDCYRLLQALQMTKNCCEVFLHRGFHALVSRHQLLHLLTQQL